mmetsp:Transcript_37924/g.108309  ORF Transcript_37924/g.108309 Transcript_37924/m.108309 type:complete len:208 (-) Transcript_37924:105-728(-)
MAQQLIQQAVMVLPSLGLCLVGPEQLLVVVGADGDGVEGLLFPQVGQGLCGAARLGARQQQEGEDARRGRDAVTFHLCVELVHCLQVSRVSCHAHGGGVGYQVRRDARRPALVQQRYSTFGVMQGARSLNGDGVRVQVHGHPPLLGLSKDVKSAPSHAGLAQRRHQVVGAHTSGEEADRLHPTVDVEGLLAPPRLVQRLEHHSIDGV